MSRSLASVRISALAVVVASGAGALVVPSRTVHAQVQGSAPAYVRLQSSTPGTPQTGHSNITGTAIAGSFQGSGSGLTNLDADKLSSGTVADARLSSNVPLKNAANVFTTQNTFAQLKVTGGTNNVGVFAGDLQPFGSAGFETNLSASLTHLWAAENGANVAYIGAGGTGHFKGNLDTGGSLNVTGGMSCWHTFFGDGYGDGNPTIAMFNAANKQYITLGTIAGVSNNGGVGVGDSVNAFRAYIFSDGSQGIVAANVKNFREPYQFDTDKDVVYACVEGPEAAAYVRGTATLVNGRATITLPDHFKSVAREDGMTVQITPNSADSKGLAVVRKSLDGVIVQELGGGHGNYPFDWEVKAVRQGYKNYKPVRNWDEDAPKEKGLTREQAYAKRQASVQRFLADRAGRDASTVNP